MTKIVLLSQIPIDVALSFLFKSGPKIDMCKISNLFSYELILSWIWCIFSHLKSSNKNGILFLRVYLPLLTMFWRPCRCLKYKKKMLFGQVVSPMMKIQFCDNRHLCINMQHLQKIKMGDIGMLFPYKAYQLKALCLWNTKI